MLLFHAVLIVFALLCLIPLISLVTISLTNEEDIISRGFALVPARFDVTAYEYIFREPADLLSAYWVTVRITAIGTVTGVFIMSMAAFALSRPDFTWRNPISFIIFFTMLFNGGLVPTYILMTQYLGLRNSLGALILPLLVNAWHVFLLRTYMKSIPFSLVESAKMEGASEFYIFLRIALPLSKAGIATIALLMSLRYWNSWFQALLYIDEPSKVPLQFWMMRVMNNINFLLAQATGQNIELDMDNIPTQSARMAMAVLAAGPMLFIFPFFQRYFARGIRVGSIKG